MKFLRNLSIILIFTILFSATGARAVSFTDQVIPSAVGYIFGTYTAQAKYSDSLQMIEATKTMGSDGNVRAIDARTTEISLTRISPWISVAQYTCNTWGTFNAIDGVYKISFKAHTSSAYSITFTANWTLDL